jgi:hypothetical protein
LRFHHFNLELYRFDTADRLASCRGSVAWQLKWSQDALELGQVRTGIEHRTDYHVATQPRKRIKIGYTHGTQTLITAVRNQNLPPADILEY